MSRSGYSDDLDGNLMSLYRGTVTRTIQGKRGQAFLKELLECLDAMPEKKLISGELEEHGAVCAIGSVGKKRGIDMNKLDPEDPGKVGNVFGISRTLAAEIVYMNDEWDYYENGQYIPSYLQTPEQRFVRMRKWVADQIQV
jgi:hypothetical protein